MLKRNLIAATAAALACGLGASASFAWPDKPVRVVVPYKAGGNTDILARSVQKTLKAENIISQPMNVVNVGGHYSIGAQQVLDADPNGTTFLLMHSGLLSAEASGLLDFGYRDFEAIAATGQFCQIPTVREDSEFDTLDDLLTAASETPNDVIFGVNLGGNNHMAALALQGAKEGAQFRFVQIGGGAANFSALTGSHTQVAIFTGGEYSNYSSSGLKALAYMGPDRLANLDELPTAAEAGYDVNYCITNFWFAPKDTPQEAIDGFADALEAAVQTDAMKDYYQTTFTAPVFMRGDQMQKQLDTEYTAIEPIAQMAKSAKK